MTKFLFGGAFLIGALAILWIGQIFLGADTLGLAVTVLIGAVYAIGTAELWLFRRASATLNRALNNLDGVVQDLPQWLQQLHPSLVNAVRCRIQGERVGLPAPVLTPYLVGLLVMLGLLGTFIGMVDTLKGAVVALEGNSELEAIRAGLAAPIEGLGLAFGTSVAGVAASAMLGLLSTLSRRERLQASHYLDTQLNESFSELSLAHQQKKAFEAIQDQAQALPAVAQQLSSLVSSLEAMGDQLGGRLLSNQQQFQEHLSGLYQELNTSVDQSLKTTLVESSELVAASIQPMADKTLKGVLNSVEKAQEQLLAVNDQHQTALNLAAEASRADIREVIKASSDKQTEITRELATEVSESMLAAGDGVRQSSQELVQCFDATTKSLVDNLNNTTKEWAAQQQLQSESFAATVNTQLSALKEAETQRGEAAISQIASLESVVGDHLTTLGQGLEAPMAKLIETASQAPQAAANVIEKLRGQMSENLERDNALLDERSRVMEQLEALFSSLESSSKDQQQAIETQRDAIETLVQRSADTLDRVGEKFSEQVAEESSKMVGVAERFASSSVEMASLSESFAVAVNLFSDSNTQLIENLTRIEAALEQSNSRSDEQLAYYVAQAREIIDHNLLSHQQIIAALNSGAKKPEQLAVQEVGS